MKSKFLVLVYFFTLGTVGAEEWPVLRHYDQHHLAKIALPLGGIGTGTVSLGGRGDLRDWEIMNRPSKGFIPTGAAAPFFCLFTENEAGEKTVRALEGPLELFDYEGSHGSATSNHGLPRFRHCSFDAAYPFGQVNLSDSKIPVDVTIRAFNPLIPGDADCSGIPIAVLRFVLTNKTSQKICASVCGNIPNFIGNDGWETERGWCGDLHTVGEKGNTNTYRRGKSIQGLFLSSTGIDSCCEQWGTMALTTPAGPSVSYRTSWLQTRWGGALLDFWDDFSADGLLDLRPIEEKTKPMASLAVKLEIPASSRQEVTFFLTWHFPNRYTWTRKENDKKCCTAGSCDSDRIGNYYTTSFTDAWAVAEKVITELPAYERKTLLFVNSFHRSDLPEAVKEAALFNISTLRTQTCFRTPDGRFFGWEGCCNQLGCCFGSCTHVWNYEQTTPYLFGQLARTMREVEFNHATDENGLMSFRVPLPLSRAQEYGLAAADGQMGCIMKIYRDWQLCGDDDFLRELWPNVRRAVEFCWIDGGWDADRDGVMDGCQHNTMDVEYYGPNPQMGVWYLGALRAAEEMAQHLGEDRFARTCRDLFKRGKNWIDENLFNGEYYEHIIQPPEKSTAIARGLRHNMGARDVFSPDYQLGPGCLVDQLVGQYMAHICGLGYLLDRDNVRKTLQSIKKYNRRENIHEHFNNMRSFVLGDEAALLMASYPHDRPRFPFPYFPEAMTGFEYTAAAGMLYEGQLENGLSCIEDIRARYDGLKRNPFDEAECGHHYARAMAAWSAVLALTGYRYSGVEGTMTFSPGNGEFFWSNGESWGLCKIAVKAKAARVRIEVLHGDLVLSGFNLSEYGTKKFEKPRQLSAEESIEFEVNRNG